MFCKDYFGNNVKDWWEVLGVIVGGEIRKLELKLDYCSSFGKVLDWGRSSGNRVEKVELRMF